MGNPQEPFKGYPTEVIRVVDGDSVWLSLDVGFKMHYEGNCRLIGIDTPERGQVGFGEAKEALADILAAASEVRTDSERLDKFGRPLVRIYARVEPHGWIDVNGWMLSEGYATVYE